MFIDETSECLTLMMILENVRRKNMHFFIFRTLLLFLFIITLFNVTKNTDIYLILKFGKFSLVIASGNLHLNN